MLTFQIFIIIGANLVATTININLQLLPSTGTKIFDTNEYFSNSSSSNSRISITNSNSGNINEAAFVRFLKYISQERSFTTIVILTNWQYGGATTSTTQLNDYCVNMKYYVDYFQHHLKSQRQDLVPVLLLKSQQSDYILHAKYNSEFVMIICIPSLSPLTERSIAQNHLLRALSKNLLYLRQNRVVIRMDIRRHDGESLENIVSILKYCHMEQIINIMIISYQFPHNDTVYYSYEKFPKFKMTKYWWSEQGRADSGVEHERIFPNKLSNIKGHVINTLPDQIEPRSMVYYDSHKEQQMGGYVAHFVKYFAKSVNGTLVLPFQVKEGGHIFYSDVLKFTRNNTIDVAVSLTGPINNTDWSEFSYPFEIANWCVMLPVEAEMSMAEIFAAVLNPYFMSNLLILFVCFTFLLLIVFKRIYPSSYRIYLPDIVINDKALRAVLGLGFPFNDQKLDYFVVYIIILKDFSGFVVAALFGIFLSSFMTSHPKYPPIKSFAELEQSGIKLAICREEYQYIYPSAYLKFSNLFHIIDSYEAFKILRNTLNTTEAYVVTSSVWPIYAAQQKFFSRQLFRYSTDLCFNRFIHLYFLLPMHSVFRDTLHLLTLKAYSSGLFFHWFQSSFLELVTMGRRNFTDITEPRPLMPIAVADFKFAFVGICAFLMLSVLIFIVEVIMGHFGYKY